jgi:hypothetical protein
VAQFTSTKGPAARAERVDAPREDALAGARLPEEEDGAVCVPEPLHLFLEALHER